MNYTLDRMDKSKKNRESVIFNLLKGFNSSKYRIKLKSNEVIYLYPVRDDL